MSGRRVLLLVSLLLLVLALSLGGDRDTAEKPRLAPVPSERAGGEQTVRVRAEGGRERVRAEAGRPLHLEVSSEKLGAVQVGTDGPISAVAPESPARFDLLYTEPGMHEIALLDPRRVVARLRVR